VDEPDPLLGCTGFDWDDPYAFKNWERHRVTTTECEEVFLRSLLVVRHDSLYSPRVGAQALTPSCVARAKLRIQQVIERVQ